MRFGVAALVLLALAILCVLGMTGCAGARPKGDDSTNYSFCETYCSEAGGACKGVWEDADRVIPVCTKRPLDPS